MARLDRYLALLGLLFLRTISAIEIDFESQDSIKSAAALVAYDLMSYYKGNVSGQTPGLLPTAPVLYYWWECGAMMGTMVDYWHYTGDDTYNNVVMQALQYQVGPHFDYMPPNETASLGNDDQSFWAMAALSAAETNFPNPAADQPSWLALAQAVFNEQIGRWDTQFCNGGIRWQIYQIGGYDLKNSIANGLLFQIGARLARYTGDDMYAQWSEKVWDWMWRIGLIDNESYAVYDNSEADRLNCTQIDRNEWSYNIGTMLVGAATMYNYTNGSSKWQENLSGLLNHTTQNYFPNGIMQDICESTTQCNVDQLSFKAYLSRWMAITSQLAPWTYDIIHPLLISSATAAAAECNGAPTGTSCGNKWYLNGTNDGTNGVGQQMSALEVILGTSIKTIPPPITNSTGGTSVGNPTAGFNASSQVPGAIVPPASNPGRAGAWVVTTAILCFGVWAIWFMWSSSFEPATPEEYFRPRKDVGYAENARSSKRKSNVLEKRKTGAAATVLPIISEKAVHSPRSPDGFMHGGLNETRGPNSPANLEEITALPPVPTGYAQRLSNRHSRDGYGTSLLRNVTRSVPPTEGSSSRDFAVESSQASSERDYRPLGQEGLPRQSQEIQFSPTTAEHYGGSGHAEQQQATSEVSSMSHSTEAIPEQEEEERNMRHPAEVPLP